MALELTHRRHGASGGRPLIILHGLLGSAGNWHTLAKQMMKDRDVYCLNLRNHGNSPHHPDMDYSSMTKDVIAWINRHIDCESVDLLGHSMGGKVAMVLALTTPQLVAKLVIVDTAPVTYQNLSFEMLDAMQAVRLKNVSCREDADRMMQDVLSNSMLRSFVLTNLRKTEAGFTWRINLEAIKAHFDDITGFPEIAEKKFTGPTLFLGGATSGYMKDYTEAINRQFPTSTMTLIPRAGHWPHADNPAGTLEALNTFFTEAC